MYVSHGRFSKSSFVCYRKAATGVLSYHRCFLSLVSLECFLLRFNVLLFNSKYRNRVLSELHVNGFYSSDHYLFIVNPLNVVASAV